MMRKSNSALFHPGEHGQDYMFDRFVYASEGLSYAASDPNAKEFLKYNEPALHYSIDRRVDYSSFISTLVSHPLAPAWPFDHTNTPLNGNVFVPRPNSGLDGRLEADHKFPIAFFIHGNASHADMDSSCGYFYLCELLATHGIIAVSIDLSFARITDVVDFDAFGQPSLRAEYGARSIGLLEHIKQFKLWNEVNSGHPLSGKIDMDRILLAGHSRGGEAAIAAAFFNSQKVIKGDPYHPEVRLDDPATGTLGPYGFNLSAVLSIAGTSAEDVVQYGRLVPAKTNFFALHGTQDGDVPYSQSYQNGFLSLGKGHGINGQQNGNKTKGCWAIFGANHTYFNTKWAIDDMIVPEVTYAVAADKRSGDRGATISAKTQQSVAMTYVGLLAQRFLLEQTAFDEVLQDHRVAVDNGWIPADTQIISQYQHYDRKFIQGNQEMSNYPLITQPLHGRAYAEGGSAAAWREEISILAALTAKINAVRVRWFEIGSKYILELSSPLDASAYNVLSFAVGQAKEAMNAPGEEQVFTISLKTTGGTAMMDSRDYQKIVYPQFDQKHDFIIQTFRIPFADMIAAAPSVSIGEINAVEFIFDRTGSGSIYICDIQVSM